MVGHLNRASSHKEASHAASDDAAVGGRQRDAHSAGAVSGPAVVCRRERSGQGKQLKTALDQQHVSQDSGVGQRICFVETEDKGLGHIITLF